jgi:hypothetical protein
MRLRLGPWWVCVFLLFSPVASHADSAAFDLSGPPIEVTVTRAGKTLPISKVPNLQAGDRLWLHADLPDDQSVHYLLIAAFLRGSTNPPPEEWFTRAETWRKEVRQEGIVVTVPKGAQQTLLFLAPETGGDFNSLRAAVRGKPGAFVRASQDLVQAGLNRSRLDKYLTEVRRTSDYDPAALHDRSTMLARSLSIKLDQGCFLRPLDEQMSCLTQNTDDMVLDDGHSQSMVATLTSGSASDLIGHVSSTPMARGGYYSAYVGAVVDVARLMSNFHTAQYQYIPGLALPREDELNIKLNNPPSFRNPKSVIVIALPAVEAEQFPPLHPVDTDAVYCLQSPRLVLPVEGAPLVFSTEYGHDFVLEIPRKSGKPIALPAVADAAQGGFAIDTSGLVASNLGAEAAGTIRGDWGFKAFKGPSFGLRNAEASNWAIPADDSSALIIGREDTFHLLSAGAACVSSVALQDQAGNVIKGKWESDKADKLKVQLPLQDAAAGPGTLIVNQFGLSKPDKVAVQLYAEAAHLDSFTIYAGDDGGVLMGTRLDEVAGMKVGGEHFSPGELTRSDEKDELPLSDESSGGKSWETGKKLVAQVTLKDGRTLKVETKVEPPRPKVDLLSKNISLGPSASSAVRMANDDQLPQDGRLSFFLKTEVPTVFRRDERIEVATKDGGYHTFLSQKDGTLILQDAQTVLALFDPGKAFGPSAFGPLRFRVVETDGGKGNWQPLATLVRVPQLKEVRCPDSPDKQCDLIGTNLFLIDSVASDPQFTHDAPVPLGFVDSSLPVPRPNGTLLYMKLRDDPSAVNTVVLPVLPE